MNLLLEHSDMARDSKGITQFYLPPNGEFYLQPMVNVCYGDSLFIALSLQGYDSVMSQPILLQLC